MFNDTIAKIREEVADITGRIRKRFKELEEDLEAANEKVQKEFNELEEDLEAANEKARKELNDLCNEYHEQLKLHYNELKATKKELAQKDEKIEKLYHDLDASDREINNLREDNVVLVERIEKLENERRISIPCKLIDELQDTREKVEELTKHNDDLRKNYKELCEHINELTQEKESLKHQVDIWKKEELAQKDEKIEKLNKELDNDRIFFQLKKNFLEGIDNAFMNDNKKEN